MASIGRRGFVKGTTLGALAFSVGGVEVIMAPGEARARNVPFRLLDAHQGETLEALGETLVPQAREAGIAHYVGQQMSGETRVPQARESRIAHYVDQQISVSPEESLLQARIFNVRPPFADFYRSTIISVDETSRKIFGKEFAQLPAADQREFVGRLRQNKIEDWKGRPAPLTYAVLRADAVDVVYG